MLLRYRHTGYNCEIRLAANIVIIPDVFMFPDFRKKPADEVSWQHIRKLVQNCTAKLESSHDENDLDNSIDTFFYNFFTATSFLYLLLRYNFIYNYYYRKDNFSLYSLMLLYSIIVWHDPFQVHMGTQHFR